jgi:hypothetical protein
MADDRLKKLYPQGIDAARKASRQMADEEFWTEVNNRLPPDSRFGGLYGLLPHLGLGSGENRAKVGMYTVRPELIDRQDPESGNYTRTNLGGYYLPSDNKEDATGKDAAFNRLLQFIGEESARGEGPNVFQTFENTEGARKYRDTTIEGVKRPREYGDEPGGFNQALIHETAHRGMDSPAMRDFLMEKYAERDQRVREDRDKNEGNAYSKATILEDYRYLDPYKIKEIAPSKGPLISTYNEHEMWSGQFDKYNSGSKKNLQQLQDEFKRWLTPEKAERYGIRLPTPSAKPKGQLEMTLDDIINFLRGR